MNRSDSDADSASNRTLDAESARDEAAESTSPAYDVAIIGGGFSGLAVAWNLLRECARTGHRLRLLLAEPAEVGAGVAYSTRCDQHLLNVPASRMSIDEADPKSFVRWLAQHAPGYHPDSFAPRALYRRYLQDALQTAEAEAGDIATLDRRTEEVVRIEEAEAGRYSVTLRSQESFLAQRIVLALGNLSHRPRFLGEESSTPSAALVSDTSRFKSVQRIGTLSLPAETDRSVLVIGTGLTAIDAVMEAESAGFTGRYVVVSRHGRWPLAHSATPVVVGEAARRFAEDIATKERTARGLLRRLRLTIAAGTDMLEAVDALRPHTASIWSAWPLAEKRRFLRHLRPIWDIHRHRAPATSLAIMEALTQSGRLRVVRGSVRRVQIESTGAEVTISRGSDAPTLWQVDVVIVCAGLCDDLRRADSPLLQSLIADGFVVVDDLGLGIRATTQGEILGAEGQVRRACFTLGSLRRGELWESIAVGEIRGQARSIATQIAISDFPRRAAGGTSRPEIVAQPHF